MSRSARRPASFPQLALLLIALLSGMVLGPAREASCAMHGMGAPHAVALAVPEHAIGHDASSHSDASHSHLPGKSGCDCSCIGACTTTAPLATPPVVATLRVALIDPEPRRPIGLEPARVTHAEPDRRLPFPNGPPASPLA